MRKRQAKTERTVGVPPWLLPLLHKNEAVGELCSLTKSPGLPVLLFLTWMASSSGSYAAGLAHSWSVESCPPPPLLAPCLLQPKRGTAARGMWPHGLLVSSRWVTKACSGSSCLLSSFFFWVFVSFGQQWNIALSFCSFSFPYFSNQRWLQVLSCPGFPLTLANAMSHFPIQRFTSQVASVHCLSYFKLGRRTQGNEESNQKQPDFETFRRRNRCVSQRCVSPRKAMWRSIGAHRCKTCHQQNEPVLGRVWD